MARDRDISSDPRYRALFQEEPERFVAARNALARDLASSGDASAAAEVRSLKRPTRQIWILNRLAREQPDAVQELFASGARLRHAHAAALRGRSDSGLREADAEISRHLDGLVTSAEKVLATSGHPASHALVLGIRNALRTIATNGGLDADRFREGVLDDEPRSSSAGAFAGTPLSVASPRGDVKPRKTPASERKTDARARKEAAASQEPARRALREALRKLASAKRELAGADRKFHRAERAAARAQAEAKRRRERADAARVKRDAARERVAMMEKAVRDTPAGP